MNFSAILIFGVFGGFIIGAFLLWLFFRSRKNPQEENLISLKFDTLEKSVKDIRDFTLQELKDFQKGIKEELSSHRQSSDLATKAMHERVRDFTESITKMHGALREVHDSVKSSTDKMSSFQDIFKTPQLRGPWGESSLEYLLKQHYDEELILHPYSFKSGEAVEFCLKLPNNLLLPIDSKFPLDAYSAYMEERAEGAKVQKMRELIQRIKSEIDDISSKYIRPQENTADFALMFIPAEAVYYEIFFNMKDAGIGDYARSKKIIITSPNTLYLTLRVIEHWFRDVKVGKETREIIKRLGAILIDGEKLGESFQKLGKHIENVRSSYEDSEKRLDLLSTKVERVISIGKEKSEKPPEIESKE